MCGSNDETRVCRSQIDALLEGGSRITFGPECAKFQWQHIIRYQLMPQACVNPPGWDKLAAKMHLVRPNGLPWSASWDRTVIFRVQNSLMRKARDVIPKGLAVRKGGKRVWHPWTKAFLSPDWDGVDFSEAGAARLL
ncbi:hypothetical protein QBC39DRAFT_239997, partial [Podospora conica]